MAESPASIVYDEARHGIERQQAVVDQLRARAGGLLAAASLVTAFLGGQALGEGRSDFDFLAWVAIAAFAVLFALVLVILWPWKFRFTVSPEILIEDHLDKTAEDLQLYLARIWEKNYKLNRVTILRLHTVFRIASFSLALEVVAWTISLGRG